MICLKNKLQIIRISRIIRIIGEIRSKKQLQFIYFSLLSSEGRKKIILVMPGHGKQLNLLRIYNIEFY